LISPEEKRFIRSWEEQRDGGKWSYYALYTFVGGFIITLLTYILLLWLLQIRVPRPYWLIPAIGLLAGAIISVIVWRFNERRFKGIIRREVKLGQEK
jgi:hypothetical protein